MCVCMLSDAMVECAAPRFLSKDSGSFRWECFSETQGWGRGRMFHEKDPVTSGMGPFLRLYSHAQEGYRFYTKCTRRSWYGNCYRTAVKSRLADKCYTSGLGYTSRVRTQNECDSILR